MFGGHPRYAFDNARRPVISAIALLLTLSVWATFAEARTSGGSTEGLTSVCATRTVTIKFDPNRSATVVSGGRLAAVSFATRWLAITSPCHRAAAPRAYRTNPLVESHRRAIVACSAPGFIKIHANGIINGDSATKEQIGNTVVVGYGEPLTSVAAVVLKNKGDPRASSLYYSRKYCR